MADPPLPYPEADKGGSYPFGYITKQPTPPDGLVAPEHPPQAALGNPPAAGYILRQFQSGYFPLQFNASVATCRLPTTGRLRPRTYRTIGGIYWQ